LFAGDEYFRGSVRARITGRNMKPSATRYFAISVLGVSALAALLLLVAPRRSFRLAAVPSPGRRASQAPSSAAIASRQSALAAYANLSLSFEPNRGQTDPRVRFISRGHAMSVFVLPGEVVFAGKPPAPKPSTTASGTRSSGHSTAMARAGILRVKFVGAGSETSVEGLDPLSGRVNYFVGNDPSRWMANIPMFEKVRVAGIYPGIDLVCYGRDSQFEFDVVVHPGANPRKIALDFGGGVPLLQRDGRLLFRGVGGEFVLNPPRVYQEANGGPNVHGLRREIAAAYVITDKHRAGIRLGEYDPALPLVLDPTLSYASYLGGSGTDQGLGLATSSSGDAYITGATASVNFPLANPYQNMLNLGEQNAFVTHVSSNGSKLIYSTYLGGNNVDQGSAIALDSGGNAYITGFTTSTTFPVMNAIQPTLAGIENAFVTELNSSGSALVYSTYLGGRNEDLGTGIAVNSSGEAYLAGMTNSSDFPVKNAVQPALAGAENAFVSKVSAGGSGLAFSTYLGGSGSDQAAAIALDPSGNAYVTGTATSTNFPVVNAFQPVSGGQSDAFITKFPAVGSPLTYSSYLGGSDADQGFGIAVDSAGDAYVTGATSSTDFPTVNPVQATLASASDAFVTELDAAGSALVYSTYLGGSGGDLGLAIAVGTKGNAYVTGQTRSSDFPIIAALQGALGGVANSFISEIAAQGAGLTLSTYYGGNGTDSGNAIAVDSSGNITIAGSTTSNNLLINGAFQPAYNGAGDAFVARLTQTAGPSATLKPVALSFGNLMVNQVSPPLTVTLTNTGNAALSISSISITGTNASDFTQTNNCPSSLGLGANCTMSVTFTPLAGGSRAAALQISDNAPGSPQSVVLSGVGIAMVPQVALEPSVLNFQNVPVGTTSPPMTITLVNNGTGTLTITTITITGGNPKDFAQTNNCGTTVAAGASCAIMVTFTPMAAGPRSSVLQVADNANNSPQQALLMGGAAFALAETPSFEQVAPGQSTSFIITATPSNMFNQTITFSCNKPPSGVTCTFLPAMLTLDGVDPATTTLTVATTASLPMRLPFGIPPLPLAALALSSLAGLTFLLRRRPVWLAAAAMVLLITAGSGCSSSGGKSSTSAGTYMIGVQGVSGTLTESVTVVLIVT
jgi:hypothetical protein